MKHDLIKTGDGSYTLHLPEWNEQYHSKHGAIAESNHVFIQNGLYHCLSINGASNIALMEIGFGTGLNALLTYLETEDHPIKIDYIGIEAYPLKIEEIEVLNFASQLGISEEKYIQLHQLPWEQRLAVSSNFHLTKYKMFFSEIEFQNEFNLIYFDAFGIRVQPELWTEDIFKRMYHSLKPKGVLVTYAANGNARRALEKVGFDVAKIPGPPGKREMIRATKIESLN